MVGRFQLWVAPYYIKQERENNVFESADDAMLGNICDSVWRQLGKEMFLVGLWYIGSEIILTVKYV